MRDNSQNKSDKFRNRNVGGKINSLKKKDPPNLVDIELPSPTKTEPPKKTQKNFVIANK